MYKNVREPSEENLSNLLTALDKFAEGPLKLIGGPYFGGKQLDAVDIHVWPFLERIDATAKTPLPADRFPNLISYIKTMKNTDGIKELIHPPDDHHHVRKTYMENKPDYNYHSKNPIYAA